jgi:hypothetical protein
MRTADVIPTNNVADWVTQAVRKELQDNGYSVTSEALDDNSESPSAVLSGEVLNVFCDMYFNYTGQVSIIVRVNKDETELINRHYAGEDSTGIVWAWTVESYAE